MTNHSDLIERLRHTDQHSQQRVWGSRIFAEAADALSSQSLSLSEARAENDRKDLEIERLKGLVAGIRETPAPAWQPIGTFKGDEAYVLVWDGGHVSEARYHPSEDGWWLANTHPTDADDGQIYPTHWMPIPAPPSALENGPAGLADATNDPADLSSLRKGAEVAVKPLEWSDPAPPNDECRYDHVIAATPFGPFSIEWKSWKAHDSFAVYHDGNYLSSEATLEAAKAAAQSDFETRIRSALVSGSREDTP